MKYAALLFFPIIFSGCSGNTMPDILDRIELGPDECGRADIRGSIDVGGNPFAQSTISVTIEKEKKTYKDATGKIQSCETK